MKEWLVILLFLVLLPLGSSSIFVGSLNPVYNLGDRIDVQTTLISTSSASDHYMVDLVCGSNYSSNIFNSFITLEPNVEKQILVTTELFDPLIYNITDSCFLKAIFGSEHTESNSFVLSRNIILDAELEFNSYDPGSSLYISGNAVEESGFRVNGFVELFIPSLNLYKSAVVTDGRFNMSLILPSDSKSGEHDIRLEVHTTDHNSRKINFGNYSDKFSLNQILKGVTIFVSKDNPEPDSEFTFRVDAVDQAGDKISKEITLSIDKPKGIPFVRKVIKSGEDQKMTFFLNDTPGYWSIEATVDDLSSRKLFYLKEVNTLQTSLINNTLIVTNIGNSPYNGPLEITIGSYVEVKQIKLNPGETQKFTLRAPDGDYSISVLESGENKNLGSAFLTGNAVKVTNFREDVINTFTDPLIWWLAVILLILIIILVQVRIRVKKYGKAPTASSNFDLKTPLKTDFVVDNKPNNGLFNKPKSMDAGFSKPSEKKLDLSFLSSKKTDTSVGFSDQKKVSPSDLFGTQDKGIREKAVAMSLYVSSSSPAVNETMDRSLSLAQETGAKVYVDGDYKVILFSPRLTHVQDNELAAVNLGRRIQALFLEHMKDHNDSARFGIGISDGEIISEMDEGKFHFTSTGNLVSYSKRLAYASNSKLLVSDSIRRKVVSTVKTEKTQYAGTWEVVKVIDHSKSRDFIKKFSERNKK